MLKASQQSRRLFLITESSIAYLGMQTGRVRPKLPQCHSERGTRYMPSARPHLKYYMSTFTCAHKYIINSDWLSHIKSRWCIFTTSEKIQKWATLQQIAFSICRAAPRPIGKEIRPSPQTPRIYFPIPAISPKPRCPDKTLQLTKLCFQRPLVT